MNHAHCAWAAKRGTLARGGRRGSSAAEANAPAPPKHNTEVWFAQKWAAFRTGTAHAYRSTENLRPVERRHVRIVAHGPKPQRQHLLKCHLLHRRMPRGEAAVLDQVTGTCGIGSGIPPHLGIPSSEQSQGRCSAVRWHHRKQGTMRSAAAELPPLVSVCDALPHLPSLRYRQGANNGTQMAQRPLGRRSWKRRNHHRQKGCAVVHGRNNWAEVPVGGPVCFAPPGIRSEILGGRGAVKVHYTARDHSVCTE